MSSRHHLIAARTATVLLLVTALSKVLDSNNQNPFFQEPDPLLAFVTNRELMLLAAMFEVGVATYLWLSHSVKNRGWALVYFCGVATTYKIGSIFTYDLKPCSCLGIIGRTLHLNAGALQVITWSLLALFFTTGLLALFHPRIGDFGKMRGGMTSETSR